MEKQHDLTTALNILSLEDSPEDYKIIFELLLAAGFGFKMNRVENEHDFVSALNTAKYDVILADFNLPQYNAFEALKKAIEICPEIPFICVSGSIGEETAIELIRKGAVDYILKDKPQKLPYAIKRALREAEEKKERKQIEDELKKSETLKGKMVANIGDVIVIIDHEGIYRYKSPNVEKLYGWKPEDLVGFGAFDNVHPDDLDDAQRFIVSLVSEPGKVGTTEVRYRHKDGHFSWIQFTCSNLLHDPDIQGLLGNYHDIATQKELINDLEEIKTKALEGQKSYKALFETIGDAIYIQDYDAKFVDVNSGVLSMYGYSKEEIIGNTPIFLSAPDMNDMSAVFESFDKVKQGIPQVFEFWGKRKNGEIFPKTVGQYKGTYFGQDVVITVARDITERKLAEDALKESEANYRILVETMPDGVYKSTHAGKFVETNPAMVKMLGYNSKEELLAVDIKNDLYIDDSERDNIILDDLNQELGIFQLRKKDGSVIWVEDHGWYSFDELGEITYHEGIMRDVTERIQKEEELIKAKEKAEESDRLKTAFLQNMSHEIRTPMNAIMGFSELLVSNFNNKPKLEQFSEIINHRCNDLLDIINDILDIAKIESGQLPITIENCNIDSLFAELKMFFTEQQARMKKEHILFDIKAHCDLNGLAISTDKVKIRQIFINLISNAFKFTHKGKIDGGCMINENQQLIFYVSDTGIGIPQEKHQYIFERFSQIEKGNSRLYGGTGLGLSIVKGLVDLLGGKMWLESEPDNGATFYFSIAYNNKTNTNTEEASKQEESTNETNQYHNKTVLVVEDDEYNTALINEILSNAGLNLLYAENGSQAIEMALSQTPELILMDIGLPDISGYEAIRQILLQQPSMKIVAQTAYANADDRNKAISAGCIDYISKPLKAQKLLSLINKHLFYAFISAQVFMSCTGIAGTL